MQKPCGGNATKRHSGQHYLETPKHDGLGDFATNFAMIVKNTGAAQGQHLAFPPISM
ncbi:hypothetical protein [Candidatus Electronema sp. JC]|uniref:hypothetical protein n=1 Tax=Candidatus Electronema sp. JC TaxID=3401570 RepID=UPI003B43914C